MQMFYFTRNHGLRLGECVIASVLRHCWMGDMKSVRPVNIPALTISGLQPHLDLPWKSKSAKPKERDKKC